MKTWKILFLSLALCLVCGVGSTARAQDYGRQHPAYLHALSDLRLMRAYLNQLTPSEHLDREQEEAIEEIDGAIKEIKEAAIDDHKDLRDHVPIDARITPSDRFRKAREAGNAAWHDLDQEEDNEALHGLKHRAMDHIERANHIVDHIMQRYGHM